jgi:hypothetical protein
MLMTKRRTRRSSLRHSSFGFTAGGLLRSGRKNPLSQGSRAQTALPGFATFPFFEREQELSGRSVCGQPRTQTRWLGRLALVPLTECISAMVLIGTG